MMKHRHPSSSDRTQSQAVALRYDPNEAIAPKIAAKGRGLVAERILALAREHDIPIREDKDLVQVLSRLDLEQEVPMPVYQAVAEILAFIYRMSQKRRTEES